jgi:hypothetical protein
MAAAAPAEADADARQKAYRETLQATMGIVSDATTAWAAAKASAVAAQTAEFKRVFCP